MRTAVPLLLACLLAAGAAAEEPTPDPAHTLELVERLTHLTQVRWEEADLDALRAGTRADPRAVITRLAELLQVDEGVPALPMESGIYSVCGNALTLLDRLTSERVGGKTRNWTAGWATRDHRGVGPDAQTIYGPWRAWLEVRKDVPVEKWFWGMSYAELSVVMPLVRMGEGEWSADALARVRALGKRVYPYLLDKLVDEGYAGGDFRVCDRANTLLQRLTGQDLGPIVRHEFMRISPDSPMRKWGYAVSENHASMALLQRQWMAALLGAP